MINKSKFYARKNTDRHYFAQRIAVRGELNFGLVTKNQPVEINLADNNINTPIIIDSIVAMAGNTTADEIVFVLYRQINGQKVRVGVQRYSNSQMPTDFPDGIIYPDMTLEVYPTRSDASIIVYCKPVKVAFRATPAGSNNG